MKPLEGSKIDNDGPWTAELRESAKPTFTEDRTPGAANFILADDKTPWSGKIYDDG